MKIIKENITDQIYNVLKEKIIRRDIKPGEQINPKDIANKYDISIMPVRDALLRLVNKGLVVNKSRVGFFVKSFSCKEIKEIMELRKMFETYCLRENFDLLDKIRIKRIKNYMSAIEGNLTREEFDKIDFELHDYFINVSNNSYLIKNYSQLIDFFHLFRGLDIDRLKEAHQEHQEILNAILDNDRSKAVEKLERHIEMVTLAILNNLKGDQDTSSAS
ncbi:MAG: hypothetical protein PWR10_1470 [Halanaerobiales bacterium]|nr:hypothetical protein [Halanaerobiales bacterium]